jgi:hypothetical protein
VPQIAKTYGL